MRVRVLFSFSVFLFIFYFLLNQVGSELPEFSINIWPRVHEKRERKEQCETQPSAVI